MALERESEQIKYSGQSKDKEASENLTGLSKQVATLKHENEALISRLESFAVEAQARAARD